MSKDYSTGVFIIVCGVAVLFLGSYLLGVNLKLMAGIICFWFGLAIFSYGVGKLITEKLLK